MYSFSAHTVPPCIFAICDCKRQFLIQEMFVCLNCSYAFCRFCSIEEIQSYYCRNCLELLPSSFDVISQECSRCFDCPQCFNILVTLACSDPKNRENILIYFQCTNCFWDSKTIGMLSNNPQDLLALVQSKAKEGLQFNKREYNDLITHYKDEFSKIEKTNAQFALIKNKKNSIHPGLSLMKKRDCARRTYWGVGDADKAVTEQQKQILEHITTLNLDDKNTLSLQEAKQEDRFVNKTVNPIFKDLYKETFVSLEEELEKGSETQTNMEQRMRYPNIHEPSLQYVHLIFFGRMNRKLYPLPVKFLPKRLRKCKKCNKNVTKSHFGSNVTADFQILSLLAENFPRLSIKKLTNFQLNKECEVIMNFENKTKSKLGIRLSSFETEKLQSLELIESKLDTCNMFTIKSPMDLQDHPEEALSRQNFIEEVKFKLKIGDQSNQIVQFGFMVTCSIEVFIALENEKIELNVPILIKLGHPKASE